MATNVLNLKSCKEIRRKRINSLTKEGNIEVTEFVHVTHDFFRIYKDHKVLRIGFPYNFAYIRVSWQPFIGATLTF